MLFLKGSGCKKKKKPLAKNATMFSQGAHVLAYAMSSLDARVTEAKVSVQEDRMCSFCCFYLKAFTNKQDKVKLSIA